MENHNGEWRKGLYRSRGGLVFGVCRGLAEYLNFSVFWMRVIWLVVSVPAGFLPVFLAYVVAALIMKPEPVVPFESEADREFYDSYVSSRSLAVHRLKRTFDALDRRIRRMESIVTARDFDWDKRMGG